MQCRGPRTRCQSTRARNDCRQFRSAGNPINRQVDLRGLVVDTAAKHPSMDKDQRQEQHLDAKKTVVKIFLGLGSIILCAMTLAV